MNTLSIPNESMVENTKKYMRIIMITQNFVKGSSVFYRYPTRTTKNNAEEMKNEEQNIRKIRNGWCAGAYILALPACLQVTARGIPSKGDLLIFRNDFNLVEFLSENPIS